MENRLVLKIFQAKEANMNKLFLIIQTTLTWNIQNWLSISKFGLVLMKPLLHSELVNLIMVAFRFNNKVDKVDNVDLIYR